MPTFNITISEAQKQFVSDMLRNVKNGAPTAIRSAINDTLRSGRTELTRTLDDILTLKQKDIRSRINVEKQATGNDLTGVLAINYQPVAMEHFKFSVNQKSGIMLTAIQGQPSQQFRHYFQPRMGGPIFGRDIKGPKHRPTKGYYYSDKWRYKRGPKKGQQRPVPMVQSLEKKFGPSVVVAFQVVPGLEQKALENLNAKFQDRLLSKIDWLLEKPNTPVP